LETNDEVEICNLNKEYFSIHGLKSSILDRINENKLIQGYKLAKPAKDNWDLSSLIL